VALARDASAPAANKGAGTRTTASFTPPAGSFLVARVSGDGQSTPGATTFTVTGGGLTWTLRRRQVTRPGSCEIWTAYKAAGGAMTVTATINSGSWQTQLDVEVFTGAEAVWGGAVNGASASSGLPSVAVTTTRDGSWVIAASADWSQAGLGTVGAGQTMDDEYNSAGATTAHAWRQTATTPTSGTVVTSNLTAPAAQDYNVAAIEIREAATATPAWPPRPLAAYPSFF